ncbi:copper homeostasis membrane protein CopD [Sphingomonas adhaesiva]|uniref:copper homeostasis membrane protein CopD n=1 Tax=Sphingomonas adhaesiva TaxID=28212 RepID=UPI002FFB1234
MDAILIAARFALYVDLAALAGLPLFWWSMGELALSPGRRASLAALALGGLILSATWLAASAAAMAGTPLLPPDTAVIGMLLHDTPIGAVLAARVVAIATMLALLALAPRTPPLAIVAALAAATLAGVGHAGAGEGSAGWIHCIADGLHAVAAAGWFGALLALTGGVARRVSAERSAMALHRFSLFGTVFVAVLVVTGAINTVMIAGWSGLPALASTLYGRLLIAKIALFGGMLLLAAANRWQLTPRLMRDGAAALPALRRSLALETALALAIIALVAALGTMDPTAAP